MKVIRNARSNHYCGPAALSLLTGKSVDEVAAALRERFNRRAIFGVTGVAMREILRQYGHDPSPVLTDGSRPTLARFLRMTKDRGPGERFLINVTGHYLVLRGRKLYDNKNPEGVFVRQYAHRRKRVKAAWRIETL